MNIREQILTLAKTDDEIYSQICTIVSVDSTANTCVCTPVNGDPKIFDVKFSPDGTPDFLVVPFVGSTVLVSFLSKDVAYVSMFSKASLYSIKTQTEDLKTILGDILDAIEQITVTTAVGQSGVPINAAAFSAIKIRLNNLLK